MKQKILLMLALWLSLVGSTWAQNNALFFDGIDDYVACLTIDATAKPNITLVSENTGNLSFYLQWGGTGNNTVYVDWGNGELISYTDNTISTSTYVAGNMVKVYSENISYFDANSQGLTALDLSNITTLTSLFCNINKIGSLDLIQNTGLTYLDCNSNNINTLDVSQNIKLEYLYCYLNMLSTLDISQNTELTNLDCKSNNLSLLDVSHNIKLETLYCYGNKLKFTSLPKQKSSYSHYEYGPQQNLVATCSNGVVDLNEQLTALDMDGNTQTTTYKWFLADGTELTNNYMDENGVFYFVLAPGTQVYCQMTNWAFSNLTLRTENITIDAKATLPEPSFTFVSENSDGNLRFGADDGMSTYIYIDWGDGVLVRGVLDGNEMIYNATSSYIANSTVKVYGCSDVYSLDLKNQQITALDVSKLTDLDYLHCSYNRLTTIDVSNIPELLALECSYNKLEALDLSQNTKLEELNCSTNGISSLNLSSNTALKVLNFSGNKISSIDLSANGTLTSLNASSNQLNYTTLPLVKTSYSANYTYDLQANLAAACTGGVVDLSAQLTAVDVDGNTQTTEYYCFLANGTYLQKGTDYAEMNGVFYFSQLPTSDVYCEMTNDAFPALSLRTENITVDAVHKPSVTFTSNKNGELSFMVSTTTPQQLHVDWGDGKLVSYEVNSQYATISTSSYIMGSQAKVFGDGIRELILDDMGIELLDISNCPELQYFACYNNNISSIDVTQNTQLYYFDCISNGISVLDVSNNPGLTFLKCFDNTLQSLDLSKNRLLQVLYCSSNSLTELDLSSNTALIEVICENNRFTFATLPQVKTMYAAKYTYNPQASLSATCTGGVVDLSSQLTATDVNGTLQTTTYKWFLADGTELAANYMKENGVFRFFVEPGTELYCQMTNAAFPGLTLRTDNIFIDAKATLPEPNITFVSAQNGSLSFYVSVPTPRQLLVDWGDGNLVSYEMTGGQKKISTSSYIKGSRAKVFGAGIVNLNLAYVGIELLDVSNCPELSYLDVAYNNITSLDVTQNPELLSLYCISNKVGTLNVSNNTKLESLFCENSGLSTLELNNNTALTRLYCQNNQFSFATLPQNKAAYETYNYAPQASLAVTCTDGVVDLSSQLTATDVNGAVQTTTYKWFLADGTELTNNFIPGNGVFRFFVEPGTELYCQMTNAAFPDLTLRTDNIFIDAKAILPEPNITFVSENTGSLSFIANNSQAGKVYVDWGDGVLTAFDVPVDGNQLSTASYTANNTVKVYGANISQLYIFSAGLTALDVSKCITLTRLDCFSNKLSSLDLTQNTALTSLFCSENLLTSIDLSHNTGLTYLNCKNNQLAALDASHNLDLSILYCFNNELTFTTLPQVKSSYSTYSYETQAKLAADYSNGVVDLGAQLKATDVNGVSQATVYQWFLADGTQLTDNVDYGGENGVFFFLQQPASDVYCTMTNEAFPGLTLQTNNITIAEGSLWPVVTLLATPVNITENGGEATIFANLSSVSKSEVHVSIAINGASTAAAGDYSLLAGSVDIPVGSLTGSVTLKAVDNDVYDGNRDVVVEIVSCSNAIERLSQQTTITINDDEAIQLEVEDPDITLSKVYDGNANAAVTAGSLTNLVAGDDVTLAATATYIDAVAGKGKTITVKYSISGADAEDYIAPDNYVTTAGEISKATLTVTANKQTKVYGSVNPKLTFSYSGWVNGEETIDQEPSISTTIDDASNTGTYTDVIILTDGSDNNYDFNFVAGDFEITKATLTVTADNQTKVYGSANPPLTFKYSGWVNGEETIDQEPSISTTIDDASNVATYTDVITLTGGSDNNYQLSLVAGDFAITKATLTVTADNKSIYQGQSIPVLTFQYAGFANSEDETVLDTKPMASTTATQGSNAGDYSIDVLGGSDNNYSFVYVAGMLTISQKQIPVISWVNPSDIVYGEPLSATQLNAGTSVPGSFVYNPAVNSVLSAGDGQILSVVFTPDDLVVYQSVTKEVTLNVKKASLTVTADDKTKVYGSENPSLTFNYSGWVNGEETIDVAPTISTTVSENANVGTYNDAIILMGGSDNNYDLSLVAGDFEVTKATLTVTAVANLSKVYGETDPVLDYSYAPELIAGNTIDGELWRTSGENVGRYVIGIGTLTVGPNYEVSFISSDFEIIAKQLAVTDPVLISNKQYDGTTGAVVTAGTLSGVIASDNGNVTLAAEANYDNASVGEGKTITVKYVLGGSASGNYIAPADYVVYTGVISEKITIAELQTPVSGCEGETLDVSYTILSGTPAQYQILFGEAAIAAGFTNVGYTSVNASSCTGTITFDVPEGVAYGTYTAKLQMRNSLGEESELYSFSFTIDLSSDYLVDKFDDVVVFDNSSELFTSYQWYKDDALVSGAVNQFYCDPMGLSGTYYVQVTTHDGKTLKTCNAAYYKVKTQKAEVSVYPNPVKSGQPFTIEVNGLASKELSGSVLKIYNMQGLEVYKSNNVEALNSQNLNSQSGNYLICITTATGKTLSVKITMNK